MKLTPEQRAQIVEESAHAVILQDDTGLFHLLIEEDYAKQCGYDYHYTSRGYDELLGVFEGIGPEELSQSIRDANG